MYSFQTGAGRRKAQKTVRILSVVVFVLAIALIGVTVSYLHASGTYHDHIVIESHCPNCLCSFCKDNSLYGIFVIFVSLGISK